jgi:anti-anti-sigma factor
MPDRSVNVPTQTARTSEPTGRSSDYVETHTEADGSLVIRPHGVLDADHAVPFRQLLVHAIRKIRPGRLIVHLGDVRILDAIHLGTLIALCDLADDHRITVVLANPTAQLRDALLAAGANPERIHYTRETASLESPEVASMS